MFRSYLYIPSNWAYLFVCFEVPVCVCVYVYVCVTSNLVDCIYDADVFIRVECVSNVWCVNFVLVFRNGVCA